MMLRARVFSHAVMLGALMTTSGLEGQVLLRDTIQPARLLDQYVGRDSLEPSVRRVVEMAMIQLGSSVDARGNAVRAEIVPRMRQTNDIGSFALWTGLMTIFASRAPEEGASIVSLLRSFLEGPDKDKSFVVLFYLYQMPPATHAQLIPIVSRMLVEEADEERQKREIAALKSLGEDGRAELLRLVTEGAVSAEKAALIRLMLGGV